jgi:hypothetical protein
VKSQVELVEASIRGAIHKHERELEKLRQALIVVTSQSSPARVSDGFAGTGIIAGATTLLSDGSELTTRQIADRLLAGGIQTRSKNFVATVHSTLRNSRRKFRHRHINDRELTWSLVKRDEMKPE